MNRLDIPLTQAFWPSDSKNVIAVLLSITVFELKAEKHSKITYFFRLRSQNVNLGAYIFRTVADTATSQESFRVSNDA
jgi:hypothetical protein